MKNCIKGGLYGVQAESSPGTNMLADISMLEPNTYIYNLSCTGSDFYYHPDIVSANDYYPFGFQMVGRSFSSNQYRYGFNGMEKDDELKGSGNSLDFGARIYDSRLGRWLSLDPLMAKYPNMSPYNSFNNNPVYYIDPDGESGVAYKTNDKNKDGKPIIRVVTNIYIYGEGATSERASTIQTEVCNQYNNDGNFFTATIDGEEYEVQFDISVQRIENEKVERKLLPGNYGTLNAENNFYEIIDNPKGEGVLGVTLVGSESSPGGNTGFIKTSEIATPTVSHELNHGYGGENKDTQNSKKTSDNDIAIQSKNSKSPNNRKVTQSNINAIFKNVSFNGAQKTNVGNPRPQLYDKTTGKSKSVKPKL